MTPLELSGLCFLMMITVGLSMWAGWEMCCSRHKQNGIDVDYRVPDFIPPDWLSEKV